MTSALGGKAFEIRHLLSVPGSDDITYRHLENVDEYEPGKDKGMTSNVSWLVEVAIKDGQVENLKDLIREMSDRAEANEPGTLKYEWTISDDGSTGHLYERYRDSEAAMAHVASFNENFAERFMRLVDSQRLFVYGSPNAALKQEMAAAGPVYMQQAGGFARENR